MKSVIIIGDGMSDYPVDALNGKTPLQVADKPHIDRIASQGRMGLFRTIRKGESMGSAVANLSVLGYDTREVYQGRAVLEAASMGVEIGPDDVALRCNLISFDRNSIKNHSAGHISSEEAEEIIKTLDLELGQNRGDRPVKFHAGVSYRHLLLLTGGWASPAVVCAPPHDHVGEDWEEILPKPSDQTSEAVATADRLAQLHRESVSLLAGHPVNAARRSSGKDTADSMWTWSPGRRPEMQTFQDRFGVSGAVISAVDLVMGLGKYAGMEMIHVPGATGLSDTNYEGKARACLDALDRHDMVYVHVEATDEAGHARDLDLKIKCIEYLDSRLVRIIMDGIEKSGIDAAVAVLPDHPTPVESGKHAGDPVPVAILRPDWEPDGTQRYDEENAANGSLGMLEGDDFIKLVLGV